MRGGTHRSVVASALRLAWAALLLMMGLLPPRASRWRRR